jgi:intracellular septation protein
MKKQMLGFFFGGLLPVIAFTLIEDHYGPLWGTVAGMSFGLGELVFEKIRYQKITAVTWIGNSMILGLGAVSIFSQNGIWFKLQPALLELFFAVFLMGSWSVGKPLLLMMAEKQNQNLPEMAKKNLPGMTFRAGIFFLIHACLATWAAFRWSTNAWALLKGVGLTVSFIFYLALEVLWLRQRARKILHLQNEPANSQEIPRP